MVFITTGPSTKLCAWGGGYWRTFAARDDEPRPVWTSLPITHCRYTRSYGTASSIGLLGQNCKPYMVVHYTFQYISSSSNPWRPFSFEAARHQPRPSTHACASGRRVRQSRGCHFNWNDPSVLALSATPQLPRYPDRISDFFCSWVIPWTSFRTANACTVVFDWRTQTNCTAKGLLLVG